MPVNGAVIRPKVSMKIDSPAAEVLPVSSFTQMLRVSQSALSPITRPWCRSGI